jgi:hypothetical protein
LPEGCHTKELTPSSSFVTARASPPSTRITWIWFLFPRVARKPIHFPSGEKAAPVLLPFGVFVN